MTIQLIKHHTDLHDPTVKIHGHALAECLSPTTYLTADIAHARPGRR
jgi:hypothetical protein